MQFEYPSQRFQDWLSQRWVMWRGRQIDPAAVPWLMGPFGNVDVIADRYVDRLAEEEDLAVERHAQGVGLLPSIDALELSGEARRRLTPQVADFYERTSAYDLEFWAQWNPIVCPFATIIHHLYSRRLQQLNLPLQPIEASRGIRSEFLVLRERASGRLKYVIWYRVLKSTQRVIYSGIYTTCRTPKGPVCVKVAFPLPRGNATVVLRPEVDERGTLHLSTHGTGFGGPGFYFLLVDKRGRYWAQCIRSWRERISVFLDDEAVLRADHTFHLWRLRVLQLHYRMGPAASGGGPPGEAAATR